MKNINFLSGVCLIFIFLKLAGVINWSWWWILSPLWLPIAIFIGVVCIGCIILLISFIIMVGLESYQDRKKS